MEDVEGYVITGNGSILVQRADPSCRWGFYLTDGEQSWDGGFGIAASWELIGDDDQRITDADREQLEWILDQ